MCRDKHIRNVQQWNPMHEITRVVYPARTYIRQLCAASGCSREDLSRVIPQKDGCRLRESGESLPSVRFMMMMMIAHWGKHYYFAANEKEKKINCAFPKNIKAMGRQMVSARIWTWFVVSTLSAMSHHTNWKKQCPHPNKETKKTPPKTKQKVSWTMS